MASKNQATRKPRKPHALHWNHNNYLQWYISQRTIFRPKPYYPRWWCESFGDINCNSTKSWKNRCNVSPRFLLSYSPQGLCHLHIVNPICAWTPFVLTTLRVIFMHFSCSYYGSATPSKQFDREWNKYRIAKKSLLHQCYNAHPYAIWAARLLEDLSCVFLCHVWKL